MQQVSMETVAVQSQVKQKLYWMDLSVNKEQAHAAKKHAVHGQEGHSQLETLLVGLLDHGLACDHGQYCGHRTEVGKPCPILPPD
ncbi:hypothetical protein P4O66_013389 [Electrophorus voltai]|uniref:Uncharacterized protein n=1 Tax=Electrophorus voltai TaxID=2609070 RepID=A0AAD9DSR3_9TELE|nr:hypothetical protein P4O66_013389 [Electrophorus voltai]